MPLKNTKDITPKQASAFWKSLGIEVPRRSHAIKNYKPKTEMAALKRLGVAQSEIDLVYGKTQKLTDKLFFRNFCRFFKRDIATVKTWTKTKSASAAFSKLFDIYEKNDITKAKEQYIQLALIFEFYRKGEGQKYSGVYYSAVLIGNFSTTNIRRRLTAGGLGSVYKEMGVAHFGKEIIIRLQRNTDGQRTNKFIKLSVERKQLQVSLSFDTKKEYFIVKSEVEKFFNTYLETPQVRGSFDKFIDFLKVGQSATFQLTGCSYLDNQFRVFINSVNNRLENVAQLDTYKRRIAKETKNIEVFNQIRIAYLSNEIKPLSISILTYKDGIFGAILLRPEDKGLTAVQRRKFYSDFRKEFGLPLNSFIDYKDLTKDAIYKHFLQVTTGKPLKVEARSAEALAIYTRLSNLNLLISTTIVEETSKVCVNRTCNYKYYPVWGNRKYCSSCGEALINGKHVEIRSIDEKSVAIYLKQKFNKGVVVSAEKKLLKRPVYVNQISIGDKTADFIPLTKSLTESQLEILQHRYPNVVIVSATDNKQTLIDQGCEAISLWEVVYSLEEQKSEKIIEIINEVDHGSLNRMRKLANGVRKRIDQEDYYKKRNQEIKNFGAELFEADCSTLFDYVFGNSLWLGAKHRGASLPDGFTAFPILQSKNGCFVWDAKFGEGKSVVMGEFTKNSRYIEEARTNSSIKQNGGLKGFVFISNKPFPDHFKKKYLALTKKRRIKVTFLRSHQLKVIVDHYRSNERLILNYSNAREQFIRTMVRLFFETAKGRKCEIVTDAFLLSLLKADKEVFKKMKTGKRIELVKKT